MRGGIIYNRSGKGIGAPSGKRVTASKLKAGRSYIYKSNYKYSTVLGITNGQVHYQADTGWESECSAAHFARTYPYELTNEEKEHIKKDLTK